MNNGIKSIICFFAAIILSLNVASTYGSDQVFTSQNAFALIDNNTAVVYTAAELNDALSTQNSISTIYLGADISLISGITILSSKTKITIDGQYPLDVTGTIHTLTGMDSSSPNDTIGLRGNSSLSLTIQNLNLVGKNKYGLFYVFENVSMENVLLNFINVTFSGTKLSFHPNGITRYTNCNISIMNGQEIGEVSQVEIGGTTTITQNSAAGYGVFSFRGSAPSLKILPLANVQIHTNNFLVRTTAALPVSIQSHANLEVDAQFGVSYNASHLLASVMVDTGANVRIIQRADSGHSTLYCNGEFFVNTGASLYMQANYANSDPLIEFTSLANSVLNISNPKSVVFYNSGHAALAFDFALNLLKTNVIIKGTQINYWTAALGILDAGKLNDIPSCSWHKRNGSPVEITAAASSILTTVSLSNLTLDDTLLEITLFQVQKARVLSVGNLPLVVDAIYDDKSPLTGSTVAKANIYASYTANNVTQNLYSTADANGHFKIDIPSSIPAGTKISFCANIPFLRTELDVVSIVGGVLQFTLVPKNLDFGSHEIPSKTVLLGRLQSGWALSIEDTRIHSGTWRLYVSVNKPLTTATNQSLPNSLVFVDGTGNRQVLGNTPFLIFTGSGNGGKPKNTSVSWAKDNGIMLYVNPTSVTTNKTYSTTITWTLTDAP